MNDKLVFPLVVYINNKIVKSIYEPVFKNIIILDIPIADTNQNHKNDTCLYNFCPIFTLYRVDMIFTHLNIFHESHFPGPVLQRVSELVWTYAKSGT